MAGAEPIQRRRVTPIDKDVANIKVLMLGEAGAGKTTLVKSFCGEASDDVGNAEPTMGADFRSRVLTHQGKDIRVNIWDVSGDPYFYEVRNEFYKEVHGALFLFDTTSRKSFQALENWYGELMKSGSPDNLACSLVGTKIESGPRMVSDSVARDWAKSKGFGYFEVSALQRRNVDAPFQDLVSRARI